jgi:hypothetical protein
VSDPELTPDGRHVIVDGRRWRASDPAIPDLLRKELVDELMRARRLVRSDGARARPMVHDAKTALGERGAPWWEPPTGADVRLRLASTIRALLRHRDGSSLCPSDAARAVGGADWRDLMATTRDVAWTLAADDTLVVTQKGDPVSSRSVRGPVRLVPGPSLTR